MGERRPSRLPLPLRLGETGGPGLGSGGGFFSHPSIGFSGMDDNDDTAALPDHLLQEGSTSAITQEDGSLILI